MYFLIEILYKDKIRIFNILGIFLILIFFAKTIDTFAIFQVVYAQYPVTVKVPDDIIKNVSVIGLSINNDPVFVEFQIYASDPELCNVYGDLDCNNIPVDCESNGVEIKASGDVFSLGQHSIVCHTSDGRFEGKGEFKVTVSKSVSPVVYIVAIGGIAAGVGLAIWFLKFRKKHTDDSDIIDVR
jgi:hypothetical protein